MAIGAVESHAANRKPVDVGRLHDRVIIGGHVIVQVVGDDEQDIGFRGGGRGSISSGRIDRGCNETDDQREKKIFEKGILRL